MFDSNVTNTPAVTSTGENGAAGVFATSNSGTGVAAISGSGTGLYAQSDSGTGANVRSNSGISLHAQSGSGTGIHAQSDSGIAGFFQGEVRVTGTVGVGTEHPSAPLHVSGTIATGISGSSPGTITFFPPDGAAWFHIDNNGAVGAPIGRLRFSYGGKPGEHEAMSLDQHGNLVVDGNVAASDLIVTGADCAEEFDITDASEIEPGMLVVLDQDGKVRQSQQAYDKRVAGVISGAGDYKPGLVLDRRPFQGYRLPVAVVGKVYCKVDARYAPIEVGDLLTTSPTPGHAMKADDPLRAFGAVIGKALRGFQSGQGLVPILVALQ
jgi:hypothetical protein